MTIEEAFSVISPLLLDQITKLVGDPGTLIVAVNEFQSLPDTPCYVCNQKSTNDLYVLQYSNGVFGFTAKVCQSCLQNPPAAL